MSTISYLIPSPSKNEDVMPDMLEQEVQFEEGLPEELTEELTDQDQDQGESGSGENGSSGSDHGGSDTGSSDGEASMSAASTSEVEGSNEQETIPETFFSAMAYSIEAFLEAIDAQQEQALMNIDLYSTQVQNQWQTTSSLGEAIRKKIRLEAGEMFTDAIIQGVSGAISMGQSVYTGKELAKTQPELDKAMRTRETLQNHYDKIKYPDVSLTNDLDVPSADVHCDPVGTARRQANDPDFDATEPEVANHLDGAEVAQYERYLKDDLFQMDNRIHGLHSKNQATMTKAQIYGELGKSAIQALGGAAKGIVHLQVADKEQYRVILESIKELISSIIQQIQGRISTTSKSALDGIDTLRNAIRQFQG